MLIKSTIALTVVLMAFATRADAESLQCSGDVTWSGMPTKVRVDIVLPDRLDAIASLPSSQGSAKQVPVGRGQITIRETTGNHSQSRNFDLYVTSLDTGIITGFFVEGILMYVVRLSPRAKVFSYFDTFREQVISGTCA
jgi:hypothetical protein